MDIILGKAKTGKSTHIYHLIEQDIQEKKRVVLFVPSQVRVKTENEYMNFLKKDGIMGVNITTISEYISESLKKYHLHFNENYITKLDRKVLLTKVIHENEDMLKTFGKVKNYHGFLDMINMYIDIFRKENLEISEVRKVKIPDPLLDKKMTEMVNIYEKYVEDLEDRFVDYVDEIDLFFQEVLEKEVGNDLKIYFDGYNNFTAHEYRFIEAFLKRKIPVTVAITTDISQKEDILSSSEIFKVANDTYLTLLKLVNKNKAEVNTIVKYECFSKAKEELIFVANHLFDKNIVAEKKDLSKVIPVHIATNPYEEIKYVARQICDLVKKGYRYQDIVIYTTHIDEYEKLIKKIFYGYHLNIYASTKNSIQHSILTKYILSLFQLIEHFQSDYVFQILKLGLNDISKEEIHLLENYLLEFYGDKYYFRKELHLNNAKQEYDLVLLNQIREKIIAMFEDFLFLDKAYTVKEFVKIVYDHLVKNKVLERYQALIDKENPWIDVETSVFEEQIWDLIVEIFNTMDKVYQDKKMKVSEFIEIFLILAESTTLKTIPPSLDEIELADINVSKPGMKKIAFFIGVNENSFPKKVEQDALLTDKELEELEEIGLDLKETSLSKINMGFYNIYEAISNVEERLYITIPAADLAGKATRISSFIESLKRIGDIKILGEVSQGIEETLPFEQIFSQEELFDQWMKALNQMENIEELDSNSLIELTSLYEYFLGNENYQEMLAFQKEDENLSNETLDMLYQEKMNVSVSRLEQFQKCPFSYYMQYTLKIAPRQEVHFNAMDLGSFMHGVLEDFSKYLFSKQIPWNEIIQEDTLKKEYENVIYELIELELDKSLKKQKETVKYGILKQKLVHTMKKVMELIAKSFCQSDFLPYGYEIEFKEGEWIAPIQIEAENGKKIILNGKIDRIDTLELEDKIFVRVVDYKSSGRTLEIDKIKEGLSLQLISYLNVFMESLKKKTQKEVIPAAMLYFNLSDKLVGLAEYTENSAEIEKKIIEALRMKGIYLKDVEILNKMDHEFSEGNKRLIDISTRSMNNQKKALEEEEFRALCKEANDLLKKIGQEMLQGIVKVSPNKKADYCQYCPYSSVCRKDITL